MRIALTVAMLLSPFAAAGSALGGDWPQILGPERNGRAADERLADGWPREDTARGAGQPGPPLVWEREVGQGYAGVAVAGGRVFLFHRVDDDELLEALDARRGTPLWKATFPTRYAGTIDPDGGPRCVPLVHAGRVYVHGAGGRLAAVDAADGRVAWTRDTFDDFEPPEGYFGVGSTPLVAGDKLLVNVGGRNGAGLVAFSLADGKTAWKSTDEGPSYSSPTLATLDGARHAIFVTRMNVVSVDPASGRERFRFPFGSRGPTVNAATPLLLDGTLFLSASYGVGAMGVRVEGGEARIAWQRGDVMSSQYSTCVPRGKTLYGIDGRQDGGACHLRAIDPARGRVLWSADDFGMATLIAADDKLLIVKTDGELVLARANPERYEELARGPICDTTTRALPALSDGRLLVRDTRKLRCFDVGRRRETPPPDDGG